MMGSQPHFYGADPALVEKFASGINPKKEEHAIFMHFEMVSKGNMSFFPIKTNQHLFVIFQHQTTGTPMSAAKRLQFNLEMVPVEDVPYLAEIQEMYYPMFWIEEGANLEKEYVKQIKTVLL